MDTQLLLQIVRSGNGDSQIVHILILQLVTVVMRKQRNSCDVIHAANDFPRIACELVNSVRKAFVDQKHARFHRMHSKKAVIMALCGQKQNRSIRLLCKAVRHLLCPLKQKVPFHGRGKHHHRLACKGRRNFRGLRIPAHFGAAAEKEHTHASPHMAKHQTHRLAQAGFFQIINKFLDVFQTWPPCNVSLAPFPLCLRDIEQQSSAEEPQNHSHEQTVQTVSCNQANEQHHIQRHRQGQIFKNMIPVLFPD